MVAEEENDAMPPQDKKCPTQQAGRNNQCPPTGPGRPGGARPEGGAGHGRVTHSEWIECAGATGAAWVANASPTKTA